MIRSGGENFFTKDPVPSKMESFEFRRTESNKELFRRLYGKKPRDFQKKKKKRDHPDLENGEGGRGSSEKDFDKSFRLRTCFLLDRFPILLDLPLIPRMI